MLSPMQKNCFFLMEKAHSVERMMLSFILEEIGPTLVFPDNSKHPFTIENYQLSTKLTKIRLYLMTTFISSDNDEEVMVLSLFLALGVGIRR